MKDYGQVKGKSNPPNGAAVIQPRMPEPYRKTKGTSASHYLGNPFNGGTAKKGTF